MQVCRSVAVQTLTSECSRCRQYEQILPNLWLKLDQLTRQLSSDMQTVNEMKSRANMIMNRQTVEQVDLFKGPAEQLYKIQRRIIQKEQISKPKIQQSFAVAETKSSSGEIKQTRRQMKEHRITEIAQQNEESFLQNDRTYIITLLDDIQEKYSKPTKPIKPGEEMSHKYCFTVRHSLQNKYFTFNNNTVIKNQEAKPTLRRIVGAEPISKTMPQEVSIKVLKSSLLYIYFGLVTDQQSKQQVRVYPRNNSAITYLARGGKHLYVLNQNQQEKMPQIEENSMLRFRVDYAIGRMEWYKNEQKIHTTDNINFQNKIWHPYVVFRDSGDSVLLF